MNFADEPDRDGQFSQPRKTVIHGVDIVHHFVHVARAAFAQNVRLGCKQVLEGTLGAFNLARQYRLFADIHENEQVGIGEREHRTVQAAQGTIGLGEQAAGDRRQAGRRGWGQRLGNEGAVAAGLGYVAAGTGRRLDAALIMSA